MDLDPARTVEEGAGSVEVCATLTGDLQRNLIVTLSTENDTAVGMVEYAH